jgi:hypothetical protein
VPTPQEEYRPKSFREKGKGKMEKSAYSKIYAKREKLKVKRILEE